MRGSASAACPCSGPTGYPYPGPRYSGGFTRSSSEAAPRPRLEACGPWSCRGTHIAHRHRLAFVPGDTSIASGSASPLPIASVMRWAWVRWPARRPARRSLSEERPPGNRLTEGDVPSGKRLREPAGALLPRRQRRLASKPVSHTGAPPPAAADAASPRLSSSALHRRGPRTYRTPNTVGDLR
jgi:hypothetical protein